MEPTGDVPSVDALREQLVQSIGADAQVLDGDIEIRQEDGKVHLLVIMFFAVASILAAVLAGGQHC